MVLYTLEYGDSDSKIKVNQTSNMNANFITATVYNVLGTKYSPNLRKNKPAVTGVRGCQASANKPPVNKQTKQ